MILTLGHICIPGSQSCYCCQRSCHVCLSFCLSPFYLYPWCMESHCTGSPLDIRPGTPNPPSRHQTWRPPATDIWWSSLETCSNLLIWGPRASARHLVVDIEAHIVSTSRRYSSYWNAFLFIKVFRYVIRQCQKLQAWDKSLEKYVMFLTWSASNIAMTSSVSKGFARHNGAIATSIM